VSDCVILPLQCCSLVGGVCVLILAIVALLEVVSTLNIVGGCSDHSITRGGVYPGHKLPY